MNILFVNDCNVINLLIYKFKKYLQVQLKISVLNNVIYILIIIKVYIF
jgi:hypothetical protein